MKSFIAVFLVFLFAILQSCSSQKKSSTASAEKSSASSSPAGNPTLKKRNAKMLDENSFLLEGISDDSTYGYDQKNTIKVRGSASGPTNERRYLNALLGPSNESITYNRLGSCCATPSKNGLMNYAGLDIYEIKYAGLEKPINLYLNMYDPGILKTPKEFTYRK
jgi:hypothetical protein